jgi:hypothetical protein
VATCMWQHVCGLEHEQVYRSSRPNMGSTSAMTENVEDESFPGISHHYGDICSGHNREGNKNSM